ncbi:glycosyltransferase family 17-domain-containing protein [Hyaloraphidium curvatum]|nr:glycosyltransferase family 17-domain-containing protein [Hyaloraphidium curvatum]
MRLAVRALNLLLRPRSFPHVLTKLVGLFSAYVLLFHVALPFFTHPLGPRGHLDFLRGVSRPLWDRRPNIPSRYLVDFGQHFDADLEASLVAGDIWRADWAARCAAAGWAARNRTSVPRLWDVVHFNNDLELLEVRLHELQHVADVVVIAESAVTYTGRPKKLFWDGGGRQELERREAEAYLAAERRLNRTLAALERDPLNAGLQAAAFELRRQRLQILSPAFFRNKVLHLVYNPTDPTFVPNATTASQAWNNEGLQRAFVYERIVFGSRKIAPGDLLLTSDADEIPRASLLWTLKMCTGYPGSGEYLPHEFARRADLAVSELASLPPLPTTEPLALHLKLHNSLYSFDHGFRSTMENWNANIQPYRSYYESPPVRFHANSEWIAARAGWHCSFCLRTLAGVEEKLRGYSHFDRLGSGARRRRLLDRREMQRALCSGRNLFGFVPEEWDFPSLVANFRGAEGRPGDEREVDAPSWLVREVAREKKEGRRRLRYLLGGRDCVREDYAGTWDGLGLEG